MEAVIICSKKKSHVSFLFELTKKMGMEARILTRKETESRMFAKKIDAGMKTASVDRNEIIKILNK